MSLTAASCTLLFLFVSCSSGSKLDPFLNYGTKGAPPTRHENSVLETKVDVLGAIFRRNVETIKAGNAEIELVFLIDASSSVGETNFGSEIKFVKNLLGDFTVSYDTTRVAIVTFSSTDRIIKNVDQITNPSPSNNKCLLLKRQLNQIKYTGGGTYTIGAFLLAKEILSRGRVDSKKVIFLITDGFSNGGDPVPVANELKNNNVTIFTLGIKNGNYRELYDLSTEPGEYFSYLLDSYGEFESLARRALHADLHDGDFVPTPDHAMCNGLCDRSNTSAGSSCCDRNAVCTCGLDSGQYSCQCRNGYYGSGLTNSCNLCANGTYSDGPNLCKPCPDINHITLVQPALNVSSCVCKAGYQTTSNRRCEVITCPKLRAPEFGYFVKKSECSNILNNACGVRCQIGYRLIGDSIRLCQSNATWSGVEPRCRVKTCPTPRAPKNGAVACYDESGVELVVATNGSVPIDTQCRFTCDFGYNLVGSKTRNCLPVSKWDGLNVYCKQIRCGRLPKVQYGSYVPSACNGEKQTFGQVCEVVCDEGFVVRGGDAERTCVGKYGHWSGKTQPACEDRTPPVIDCPRRVRGTTMHRKNHGFVGWDTPAVHDNSGLNVTVWTKPAIKDVSAFKFKIGTTNVTYVAVDAFKNRATCTVLVEIEDIERPVFEDCIDPPIFLSNEMSGTNITWDEPTVHDNSQLAVTVTKSHEFGFFPIGTTSVTYTASDMSNNTAACIMNITVQESKCNRPPDPPYGKTICKDSSDGVHCIITCHEGYAFAIDTHYDPLLASDNDTYTELVCNDADPTWSTSDDGLFPDCTVTEVPGSIDATARLESDADVCADGADAVGDQFTNVVRGSIDDVCGAGTGCTVTNVGTTCTVSRRRRRRGAEDGERRAKKRHRVDVKFRVVGNGDGTKGRQVSFERFKKIRERIKNINRTSVGTRKGVAVDVDVRDIAVECKPGFIGKLERCVRCPKGTFQNATRNSCQSCPIGSYNDKTGRTECTPCPESHSTRRIHSKSVADCKARCPAGTRARKRTVKNPSKKYKSRTTNPTSLMPFCVTCPIGRYQPAYGQTECLACPSPLVTASRGSVSIDDCVRPDVAVCSTGICNDGECILDADASYYSCECRGDYVGSNCETRFDSCASGPCRNGARCVSAFDTGTSASSYACECPSGYIGTNCELVDERCTTNTCKHRGNCTRNEEGHEVCRCEAGFVGDSCEIRISRCTEDSCSNGGFCVEGDETFECRCIDGFLGKRCDVLPCDFMPCPSGTICVDFHVNGTATKDSYRCECPEGYTGANCTDKIDYCRSEPCSNGGRCVPTELGFECACVAPYRGPDCRTKSESKYIVEFPRSGTTDYVRVDGPTRNLTEISVCLWMKSDDTFNYGTIFSYASESHDNAFTATDYNGLVLYVNGAYRVTDVDLNDGEWHFLCVTWTSLNGAYAIYVDGTIRDSGIDLSSNATIQSHGQLVVGQEQDGIGGRFSQSESFVGFVTNVDVWNYTLDRATIVGYMETCDEYYGNVAFWAEFQEAVNGDVKILDWTFCRTCPSPNRIYNGHVVVVDKMAVYHCDAGYSFGSGNETFSRKCTKATTWDGPDEPICKLVSCDFPGRIANGFVHGSSYYYGDVVTYTCEPGYDLVGMRSRTCLGNGTWSYISPYCMGNQCDKLAKLPSNCRVTVLSEQLYDNEFESLRNSHDVGTQIEFECLDGTRLVGESIITCIDNGTWDADPPVCEETTTTTTTTTTMTTTTMTTTTVESSSVFDPTSTSAPPTEFPELDCTSAALPSVPPNGYYVDAPTARDRWPFGSKIEFKCRNGYELAENDGHVECVSNGKWTDVQTGCTPVRCPNPPHQRNMKIVDKLLPDNRAYHFGNMVRYVCVDGYELYGNSVVRCQSNGKWSRVTGKCARVSCDRPRVPEGATIVGDSYLFQDKLKIECPVQASKTYVIVECHRNRTWLPEIDCS